MTEVVKPDHNKFTALHAALWDTGAFIYVPKNVKVELPLQVILHQASRRWRLSSHAARRRRRGRSDRWLTICWGARMACRARLSNCIMGDNSIVRYMNLQDFDHSTWNFLTGRAMQRNTDLRWIQVSWGSRLTKAFLDVDLMGQGGARRTVGHLLPHRPPAY